MFTPSLSAGLVCLVVLGACQSPSQEVTLRPVEPVDARPEFDGPTGSLLVFGRDREMIIVPYDGFVRAHDARPCQLWRSQPQATVEQPRRFAPPHAAWFGSWAWADRPDDLVDGDYIGVLRVRNGEVQPCSLAP